jgi:hypothetical protein
MTRLSNHEVVLGKLLASLLDVLVMLATALPIFLLLTLFGGVSPAQVARVFAVTLATILAAGSLGSTVALARDKTFQSLAMTALVLVIWIGTFEALALAGSGPLAQFAAAASPVRAILTAAHPFRDTQGFWAIDTWFVVVALGISILLNALAIARLRVWNPGRELLPTKIEEEEPKNQEAKNQRTEEPKNQRGRETSVFGSSVLGTLTHARPHRPGTTELSPLAAEVAARGPAGAGPAGRGLVYTLG